MSALVQTASLEGLARWSSGVDFTAGSSPVSTSVLERLSLSAAWRPESQLPRKASEAVSEEPRAAKPFTPAPTRPAPGSKQAVAAVLRELKAQRIPSGGVRGLEAKACQEIARHRLDDTFYVIDLANVLRMFKAWKAAMPRVTPFYAVKCFPEPGVLQLLDALGAGFDCASKGELETVLGMGVQPSRIIFAHPCKRGCDFRFAKERGVEFTTFDTLSELHKVASMHPGLKLVLRIRADDPQARVHLGLKYGACPDTEAPQLLREARRLGLNVVGVSFHVGSGCRNLDAFTGAIANARKIFDQATALGFRMELLDIGGGFTGRFDAHGNVMFGEIASTINAALATYFPLHATSYVASPFSSSGCDDGAMTPDVDGVGAGAGGRRSSSGSATVVPGPPPFNAAAVRVIAEPGRYFAETSAALLTPVYGQRDRLAPDGEVRKDYYITDGLYGSFNCIVYDGQAPEYRLVRSPLLPELPPQATPQPAFATVSPGACSSSDVASLPGGGGGGPALSASASAEAARLALAVGAEPAPLFSSTLWGPTCDSADCVYKGHVLPALRNGDWLLFPNAGAYTVAGACDFNGIEFTSPRKVYVFSDKAVDDEEEEEKEEGQAGLGLKR